MLLLHNSLFGNPAYLCGFAVPMEGGCGRSVHKTPVSCVYTTRFCRLHTYTCWIMCCAFFAEGDAYRVDCNDLRHQSRFRLSLSLFYASIIVRLVCHHHHLLLSVIGFPVLYSICISYVKMRRRRKRGRCRYVDCVRNIVYWSMRKSSSTKMK